MKPHDEQQSPGAETAPPEAVSRVNTSQAVRAAGIAHGHAWTGKDGGHHAVVSLGYHAEITLSSVAAADALAAAAAKARDALAEFAMSASPATAEEQAEFRAWREARSAAAAAPEDGTAAPGARDGPVTGYVHPVGDPIGDENGQPDLIVGVDHDTVTVSQGAWAPGGEVFRLDAAQAEDFAALFTAACWQASANAARMRIEHDDDNADIGASGIAALIAAEATALDGA